MIAPGVFVEKSSASGYIIVPYLRAQRKSGFEIQRGNLFLGITTLEKFGG